MSFLLHDSLSDIESAEITGQVRVNVSKQGILDMTRVAIFEEKLRIPDTGKTVARPRLLELLERSIAQYGATLISGRAGTGKTTLAADHARKNRNRSWYTIEPADSDWQQFSASFTASIFGPNGARAGRDSPGSNDAGISDYLTETFKRLGKKRCKTPRLIVLDNVHHLFDAEWFAEFFRQLVVSLDENARLLMLCRSKPSAPLWRLRSKQMLNVIDENLLDLSEHEAEEIGRLHGATDEQVRAALKRSYGKVGTFLKLLEELEKN